MRVDWEEEWRAAHDRSLLKVTSENEAKWRDFWSMDAEYYLEEVRAEMDFYISVVDRLAAEDWVRPEDAVLDVGCGPGTLALPLAERVRSVTALDEAEGMLEALMKESGARRMSNIAPQWSSWSGYRCEQSFDLVLASLSPAVRCGTDLWAMEGASRDRCCLITSCPSDWMAARNELWERVVGRFVASDAYAVRYPLNLLLDRGRIPELFRVSARTRTAMPVRKVIDHYIRYFSIFTEMDGRRTAEVEEYVLSRSTEGQYIRESEKCLHLLCWKVPKANADR